MELNMNYKDSPIHALAAFNPEGRVVPRYFRIETADHRQHTITVSRVITSEAETFCGFHRIHYFCEAFERGRQPFFCELYFTKETSKWVLGDCSPSA